jgi:hypothetical protein
MEKFFQENRMGNSATKELAAPAQPYFLIERILTPEIRVGVVGGSEQTQGIRVADGEFRRLKGFESGADELNYMFEKDTALRLYRCPTDAAPKRVCYTLSIMDPLADELNYMFGKDSGLRLYRCPPLAAPKQVSYALSVKDSFLYPLKVDSPLDERIRETFKPISMGDATKEIDAMGDLFAGKN